MRVEIAPAKVNLALQLGGRRDDGLHELCSLFARVDLADTVSAHATSGEADVVTCPGVEGENLALAALAAYRRAAPEAALPPLMVEIEKRIPVAAGLGGGSADAAAALRIADELRKGALGLAGLRQVAAGVGADVPSQVEPRHSLVTGAGEGVEPIDLPRMWLVLVPDDHGLATAEVFAEADRQGLGREVLDADALRHLAAGGLETLCAGIENDLTPAADALRPRIADRIAAVRATGALAAEMTGSGPTVFGVFADERAAARAARELPGALVTGVAP